MESSPQDDGGPFYRALRDLKFSPTIIGGRGGGGWGLSQMGAGLKIFHIFGEEKG